MAGYDGMDAAFASALQRMIAASGGRITINSGFRTVERQAQLFANAVKKYGSEQAARRYVAPPGKSNHNRGIAADLGFNTPEAREWAHANAARFGLIFPMDYEPWHIEPANARDGADPQAYPLPVNGALHPQDPQYSTVKPELHAANLAYALGSYDPNMAQLLEGEYPASAGGAEPVAAQAPAGGAAPTGGGGGESGMGGDAESWIRQAMKITGVDESWYPGLMRQMMHESGGRNIPQGIVDVNTRKGTPAFGPMQVIQPTFNAHALPGYTNWHDPLHNTIAAIQYIKSRYGHPNNLKPNQGY